MQEHSIEDQVAEIRAWASKTDTQLLHVFKDDGVSGAELELRPGIRDLFAFLRRSPERGTLVVWKRNRLLRPDDPRDGLILEREIEKLGWRIHFLQGSVQTGEPLIDAILSLLQHHESGQYSKNVSGDVLRGHLRRALDGDLLVGKIPFGFAKLVVGQDGRERVIARLERHRKLKVEKTKLVPGCDAEVAVVRRVFSEYASGSAGMAEIAARLNGDGIRAPEGGTWVTGSVRELLRNRCYAGDLVWNKETTSKFFRLVGGEVVRQTAGRKSPRLHVKSRWCYAANDRKDWVIVRDHHIPLVDRATFERVQEIMASRAGARGGQRNVRLAYPLTGRVFCGKCGRPMTGNGSKAQGRTYRRYFCAGWTQSKSCDGYVVRADQLEHAALRKLQSVLLDRLPKQELRDRIVSILRQRLTVPHASEVQELALAKEREDLDRRIRRAIENMGVLEPDVATEVGRQIGRWGERKRDIDAVLKTLHEQAKQAVEIERAADDILTSLNELAEITAGSPAPEQRKFFERTVARVEVFFEPPATLEHRKRRKHTVRCVKLVLAGPAAVAVAAARPASESWLAADGPADASGRNSAAEADGPADASGNNNGLPDLRQAVVCGASSSGRTRTYNQVVNSHLLYH